MSGDGVDADPFAVALIEFLNKRNGYWDGLASLLLEDIPKPDPIPRSWPKDASRFGTWVRRYSRVLEAVGIEIVKDQQTRESAPLLRDRIVDLAFERGLLILGCGENSIRLAPPLIVHSHEATIALDILEDCVAVAEQELSHPAALAGAAV